MFSFLVEKGHENAAGRSEMQLYKACNSVTGILNGAGYF